MNGVGLVKMTHSPTTVSTSVVPFCSEERYRAAPAAKPIAGVRRRSREAGEGKAETRLRTRSSSAERTLSLDRRRLRRRV